MSLRSPMGRVLGLGSAKDGTSHWWSTRVTSLALVPLCIWFVVSLYGIDVSDHGAVVHFMRQPINTILLLVLVPIACYHSMLGTQEIVEDYQHDKGRKVLALILLQFLHTLVAVSGLYAVLKVAFGSSL